MKKLVITIIVTFTFLSIFATPTSTAPKDIDYLMTNEGIIFVMKIRHGFNNKLVAKTAPGEKMKIDKDKVTAYRKNGREFRKMMFVEEGADYVSKNYYAVKFNAEGNETIVFKENTFTNPNFDPTKKGRNSSHQLAVYFGVKAFPTILFLDEESNFIVPLPGYKTPRQLEIYLKLFKTDDYKNVTSQEAWEDYSSNFKYEFNE